MVTARKTVKSFRWDSPMLLIFAPAPSDRTYRLQMEQLDSIRLALEDQRVIIAEIFENAAGRLGRAELSQERCRDFRRQFNVPPGYFKVILMGRNSVTHLCSNECISWQELMLRMEKVSEFQIPAVL